MKRSRIVVACVLAALAGGVVWFKVWAEREELECDGIGWAWRSKYYPVSGDGCQLLDRTLGAQSRTPRELLQVMRWQYHKDPARNPHGLGFPDFFDVQHQALVRLLALQQEVFGNSVPPQHEKTVRADHSGVRVRAEDAAGMTVEGTASVFPDEFDDHPWEGYFRYEAFQFDKDGRLLSRRPLTDLSQTQP